MENKKVRFWEKEDSENNSLPLEKHGLRQTLPEKELFNHLNDYGH
jgi:hypothetical protein